MVSHKKQHVLSSLDNWATNIVRAQKDLDILDLDQSFWLLVSQLSKSHPQVASDVFRLSSDLVDQLATLEVSPVALASGVFLSFAPVVSNDAFNKACEQSASPRIPAVMSEHRPVDIAYWQTMVRISEKRGAAAAALIFGVPKSIVSRVTGLGFSGARNLANVLDASWVLRCRPSSVSNALESLQRETQSGKPVADTSMLRLAQSLSNPHSIR